MKKQYVNILLFLTLWMSSVSVAQTSGKSLHESLGTPNILFIMTDDQAPWAVGSSGNVQAITPNIDRLAAEGMSLPNSYTTTPVCTPSRAGLMTSRYGYELGLDDWINPKAKSLSGNDPDNGLGTAYETWPEVLQRAGYHTGLVGKWHLGYLDNFHPTNHGYDEFTGFLAGGTTPSDPLIEKNGVAEKRQGLTTDILTAEALEFIEKNKDRKFALSLHYRAPHAYWLPVAPEDEAPYLDMDMNLPHPDYPDLNVDRAKRMMREYLSSVRGVDRNLGIILAKLDELELSENTLIVFTSDHGYNMGHNGIWHKGNGLWLTHEMGEGTRNVPGNQRPNMYENSLKVPAIVKWPSVVKAGVVNKSSMSNLDWFPTLVRIAGGKTSTGTIVRGQDFVPALLDESVTLSTGSYAAYSTKHQSVTLMRSYSDGAYKLVRDFLNEGRDEFYDLINDPAETVNLIDTKSPELLMTIERLHGVTLEKIMGTNDPALEEAVKRGDFEYGFAH